MRKRILGLGLALAMILNMTGVASIAAESEAPDLTPYQWEKNNRTVTIDGVEKDPGIHVPNWNSPEGNMDREVIVAVIDTGIDWRHSEFKDKIVTFTKEQQKQLGCTEHGFAVDGSLEDEAYLDEMDTHGTHLAGIIGAAWDGVGVSGIGSNIKFLDVSVGANGSITVDSIIKVMNFIIRCKKAGIDVKVTNNSYMLNTSSPSIDRAIRRMGKLGIISCAAAGNDDMDLDYYVNQLSFLRANPYAIVVEGSNVMQKKYHSSNFSSEGAHISAPGESILSSINKKAYSESVYMPGYAPTGADRLFFDGAEEENGVTIRMNKASIDDDDNIVVEDEMKITQTVSTDMVHEGAHAYQIESEDDDFKNGKDGNYVISFDGLKPKAPENGQTVYASAALSYITTGKEGDFACQFRVKMKDGTWKSLVGTGYDMWACPVAKLPKNTDWDNFGLQLFATTSNFEGSAKLYIDSLTLGTKNKDLYGYTSGTSMASPQAVGAAALMFAAHPDESAEQIRARVIGSVTPVDAFKDMSATGGLLDLRVTEDNYGPTIAEAKADTQTVTLNGYYFGDEAGSVSATLTKNGVEEPVDVRITSWTDRKVTLAFDCKAEGSLSVNLTKKNQKSFRIRTNIEGTERNWQELATPDGIDNYESDGLIATLGDKIYYFPYRGDDEGKYVRKMYTYDTTTGTWTKGKQIPKALAKPSVVVWKGQLFIRGKRMESVDGMMMTYTDYNVFSYEPVTGTWLKRANAEGLESAALAKHDGGLVLVGTVTQQEGDVIKYESGSEIHTYDPKKGVGKKIATLKMPVTNGTKTANLDGKLYVFSYVKSQDRIKNKNPLFSFQEVSGKKVTDLSQALPIRYEGASINGIHDASECELIHNRKGTDGYSLVSVKDKIVLFGRDDVYQNKNSWTYTPGDERFAPLPDEVCDDQLLMSRATAADGKIYNFVLPMNPLGQHFLSYNIETIVDPDSKVLKSLKKGEIYLGGAGTEAGLYIVKNASKKTVWLYRSKVASTSKKATIPAKIKMADGKTYKVVGISAKAFAAKKKVKTLIIKTTRLTAKTTKKALAGSIVKTLSVKVGSKKKNTTYLKKYRKIMLG